MYRFIIFFVFILFACTKEQLIKEETKVYSEWENYFVESDHNSYMGIYSLAVNNNVLIMSAYKRIDFTIDYSAIFTFNNGKIIEIDSADFLSLDQSLKPIKGINGEPVWYSKNLFIKYDKNEEPFYAWQIYDFNNMLESSKIKLDKYGNLWEASNDGINKFDGLKWTRYFKGNIFWAICFDKQNNLYASTMSDLEECGVILKYN